MEGRRFFTVPYDIANRPETKIVRYKCGGIVALGRWIALLGLLYDAGGAIDLTDSARRKIVAEELELHKANQLENYFSALCDVGWINRRSWEEFGHVVSAGVYEQLDYRRKQSERAKGGSSEALPDSSEESPDDGA